MFISIFSQGQWQGQSLGPCSFSLGFYWRLYALQKVETGGLNWHLCIAWLTCCVKCCYFVCICRCRRCIFLKGFIVLPGTKGLFSIYLASKAEYKVFKSLSHIFVKSMRDGLHSTMPLSCKVHTYFSQLSLHKHQTATQAKWLAILEYSSTGLGEATRLLHCWNL